MASSVKNSIAIIAASTRQPRVGKAVAESVKNIIEKGADLKGLELPLVDLAEFKLPVYDEAVVPAQVPDRAQFSFEHSKKWSAEIKKHDGYILVSPEYNYGVPGGVKNAIDYLFNEWKGKPIAIVTYGVGGGAKSSDQLKEILSGVGLRVAETRPQLAFKGGLGPEVFAAMAGKLGEDTRAAWEVDQKDALVEVVSQLKVLLATEPAPVSQ